MIDLTPQQELLIHKHLESAQRIAYREWKKAAHVLDRDDLTSAAYEGLVQAALNWENHCLTKGYDPAKIGVFYKYANPRIRGAVIDYMRFNDRSMPRGLHSRSKKLRAAGQDQGASVKEMAQRSGLTEKEVNSTIFDLYKRPVSIEAEDIDYSTDTQSIESSVVVQDMLKVFVDTIREMDELSQTVLVLHYYQKVQLQRISKILGISSNRATTVHIKSIAKVRQALMDAANMEER